MMRLSLDTWSRQLSETN